MKIEEAIHELILQKDNPYDREVTDKTCDVAIVALEKQMPKPPENKVHEKYTALGRNYYCQCGVMFVDWENYPTNYCGNCGQRLK